MLQHEIKAVFIASWRMSPRDVFGEILKHKRRHYKSCSFMKICFPLYMESYLLCRNVYWKLYICFSNVSLVVPCSLYFFLNFTCSTMNKTKRSVVEWCVGKNVFKTEITYMPVSPLFFFFWNRNYPQPMSFALI